MEKKWRKEKRIINLLEVETRRYSGLDKKRFEKEKKERRKTSCNRLCPKIYDPVSLLIFFPFSDICLLKNVMEGGG